MARTLPPESPGKTYLDRLGPIIRPIYSLLEAGVLEAYRFHDDKQATSIDPWLFSHLVRWHLCQGLDEIQKTGDLPFVRITKSMSGIEVIFDGLTLKVLRPGDDDNNLPIAKSEQQRLFYTGNLFASRDDEFFIINNLVFFGIQIMPFAKSLRHWSVLAIVAQFSGASLFPIPQLRCRRSSRNLRPTILIFRLNALTRTTSATRKRAKGKMCDRRTAQAGARAESLDARGASKTR